MAREWWSGKDEPDVLKGLVAGAIAGVAGAWMMNRYHTLVSRMQDDEGEEEQGGREAKGEEIGGQEIGGGETGDGEAADDAEPATEKAATAVVTGVFGHEMDKRERKAAGSAVHYGFGASMGAAYGVLSERVPVVRTGFGTAYGAGVWLAADEGAVPALGLAKPAREHAMSVHVNALVAHLVFGVTVEVVRRVVRAIWR